MARRGEACCLLKTHGSDGCADGMATVVYMFSVVCFMVLTLKAASKGNIQFRTRSCQDGRPELSDDGRNLSLSLLTAEQPPFIILATSLASWYLESGGRSFVCCGYLRNIDFSTLNLSIASTRQGNT